ncbi:MAG: hypothetical protein ABJA82_15940 [Myxococcales bacterium]
MTTEDDIAVIPSQGASNPPPQQLSSENWGKSRQPSGIYRFFGKRLWGWHAA